MILYSLFLPGYCKFLILFCVNVYYRKKNNNEIVKPLGY